MGMEKKSVFFHRSSHFKMQHSLLNFIKLKKKNINQFADNTTSSSSAVETRNDNGRSYFITS